LVNESFLWFVMGDSAQGGKIKRRATGGAGSAPVYFHIFTVDVSIFFSHFTCILLKESVLYMKRELVA
jgi:hypothetical protein